LIISSNRGATNLEDACPTTNAIAKPIIPKVLGKSKNSHKCLSRYSICW
jgi:hypothetical protein